MCNACPSGRTCVSGNPGALPERRMVRFQIPSGSSFDQVCVRPASNGAFSCFGPGGRGPSIAIGQLLHGRGVDVEVYKSGALLASKQAWSTDSIGIVILCIGLQLNLGQKTVHLYLDDP